MAPFNALLLLACLGLQTEAFRMNKKSHSGGKMKSTESAMLRLASKTNTTLPPVFLEMLQQSSGAMDEAVQESLARMDACGEACTDPVSAEMLMQGAIEAAKLAVGVIGEVTQYVLKELQSARDEIAEWRSKIEDLAEVDMVDYTIKVARATTTLNQNEAHARALYRNMLDLTEIIVEDLEFNFAGSSNDEQMEACRNAQEAMSVALESAIEEFEVLIPKTAEAAGTFAEVRALSENYETRIRDNMNNKDGFLDAREAHLRGVVYGSCGAGCVIMPPSCPVCFAIGAPILETKLAELRSDLEATKTVLHSIMNRFKNLKDNSEKLGNAADSSHDNMVDVNTKMKQTLRLTNRKITLGFWKSYVLRDVKKLNELLESKLA